MNHMGSRKGFIGMRTAGILLAIICTSCTTNQERFSDLVSVSQAPKQTQVVDSKASSLLTKYTFNGSTHEVETLTCVHPQAKGSWLLMNRDMAGFNYQNFCLGWIAQSFLQGGYSVVGINRPGYGRSSGFSDFSGPQSLEALEQGIRALPTSDDSLKNHVGIWGYSSGSIAALYFAKKHAEIPRLILGAGIYDLEIVHKGTNDPGLKHEIDVVTAAAGEKAYEERSVSWDFNGLPKKVDLYHGSVDEVVPVSQATSFRNSLAAQEYEVSLQIIEKAGHQLPWLQHQQVISRLLAPKR
jgi:pimeloyl-ACP methyl ester carboxylesterase